jgi:hypothetical protein
MSRKEANKIGSMPVPAWTSKALSGIQKRKMEATDARIKAVKEALNVLRMVKQFGWEEEVKKQIEAHRAEELKWIVRSKIFGLAIMLVK